MSAVLYHFEKFLPAVLLAPLTTQEAESAFPCLLNITEGRAVF